MTAQKIEPLEPGTMTGLKNPKQFPDHKRVVAYYAGWSWGQWRNYYEDLQKLTHVNIAFVNPKARGHIGLDYNILNPMIDFINEAHSHGVRVLVSLGGASAPDYSPFLTQENVEQFCRNIVSFLKAYKLDGIDIDIEGDRIIESQYNAFIATLAPMMEAENLLLTAALGMWRAERIYDETLRLFEFINVMAYDATGAWDQSNPGQHSSITFAQENLDFWRSRGVPRAKLVLGVPFYGVNWNPGGRGAQLSYRRITSQHPEAYRADQVEEIFYNGVETIAAKAQLAMDYGGIMVWEISQDSIGQHSLLDVIDRQIALH